MKEVDTNTYIGVLKELLEQGRQVSLVVTGSSMAPFLADHRDTVYLNPVTDPLRPGDIVLYQRANGQYVLHRIVGIHQDAYDLLGDNQTVVERGIHRNQIVGLVTAVNRKGEILRPGDKKWDFFAGMWRHMVPFRHGLIRMASGVRKTIRKQ